MMGGRGEEKERCSRQSTLWNTVQSVAAIEIEHSHYLGDDQFLINFLIASNSPVSNQPRKKGEGNGEEGEEEEQEMARTGRK